MNVIGHGYEVARDGFGFRGVKLTPQPGQRLQVKVERHNLARRLGRLTGGGLFAESQKLGEELDWKESGVFGCDSVLTAAHRGKLFWAWGDTTLPGYALGIYDTTSATTALAPLKSLAPPLKLPFDLFSKAGGAPRGVAKMAGEGPTWLTGYVSLPDHDSTPHLVATYAKIRHHLEVYEVGLCAWNDAEEKFEPLRVLWTKTAGNSKAPLHPDGQPAFENDATGKRWLLFGNPLPRLRCPATFEAWQDANTWESLQPQESLPSATDGTPVKPHTGSIAWSVFRQRWVTIFVQSFGHPSALGEVWYAEANAPTGPWGPAIKVLTHDNYTFYNPLLHPELTPDGSPILLFEGTFTAEFADHASPVPRYNYNQILYRLDLDAPALALTHGTSAQP